MKSVKLIVFAVGVMALAGCEWVVLYVSRTEEIVVDGQTYTVEHREERCLTPFGERCPETNDRPRTYVNVDGTWHWCQLSCERTVREVLYPFTPSSDGDDAPRSEPATSPPPAPPTDPSTD